MFALHPDAKKKLELFKADLLNKDDWDSAVKDVDFILHVASPCKTEEPKDPDEIIIPAVNGVKNVLLAALKYKVKKVVLTSSTTAIAYGINHETPNLIYKESDWSPDDLKI